MDVRKHFATILKFMALLNEENINLVKTAWGHCERLSNYNLLVSAIGCSLWPEIINVKTNH